MVLSALQTTTHFCSVSESASTGVSPCVPFSQAVDGPFLAVSCLLNLKEHFDEIAQNIDTSMRSICQCNFAAGNSKLKDEVINTRTRNSHRYDEDCQCTRDQITLVTVARSTVVELQPKREMIRVDYFLNLKPC